MFASRWLHSYRNNPSEPDTLWGNSVYVLNLHYLKSSPASPLIVWISFSVNLIDNSSCFTIPLIKVAHDCTKNHRPLPFLFLVTQVKGVTILLLTSLALCLQIVVLKLLNFHVFWHLKDSVFLGSHVWMGSSRLKKGRGKLLCFYS